MEEVRHCGSFPGGNIRWELPRGKLPTVRCLSEDRRVLLLADVAAASTAVAAVPARTAKIAALAELLGRAGAGDVAAVVSWLSGELTQRQIGVGYALLREPPPPAAAPSLTVAEVEQRFAAIGALGGKGSTAARREALAELLARATADEQAFLVRLLLGDLRQGALAGVMSDAVAGRRGGGDRGARRADAARRPLGGRGGRAGGGSDALAAFRLEVGCRSLRCSRGTAAVGPRRSRSSTPPRVDAKLDGARVQVHRDGSDVAVFTRSLDDVTARLPGSSPLARTLPVASLVLDGEAIALREDGRPLPFQVTASRFGTTRRAHGAARVALLRRAPPRRRDLLVDRSPHGRAALRPRHVGEARRAAHARRTRAAQTCSRRRPARPRGRGRQVARRPLRSRPARRELAQGQARPHARSRRARDRVGLGRRRGKLSNIHLGARDPAREASSCSGRRSRG